MLAHHLAGTFYIVVYDRIKDFLVVFDRPVRHGIIRPELFERIVKGVSERAYGEHQHAVLCRTRKRQMEIDAVWSKAGVT